MAAAGPTLARRGGGASSRHSGSRARHRYCWRCPAGGSSSEAGMLSATAGGSKHLHSGRKACRPTSCCCHPLPLPCHKQSCGTGLLSRPRSRSSGVAGGGLGGGSSSSSGGGSSGGSTSGPGSRHSVLVTEELPAVASRRGLLCLAGPCNNRKQVVAGPNNVQGVSAGSAGSKLPQLGQAFAKHPNSPTNPPPATQHNLPLSIRACL